MSKAVRTQASTFDPELFSEVQDTIAAQLGQDSGIPSNFEDVLLGQDVTNDAEANYQRGQECAAMISMLGWGYTKESLAKIEARYKREFEDAEEDTNNQLRIRYHAARQIVKEIIQNVELAATVPHPDELPQ